MLARRSSAIKLPASCSISSAVSFGLSGSSSTVVAFTLPPAHPGRRSSSSGRAMQSEQDRRISCQVCDRAPTRSRNVCSAQWMSSKITTSGCSAASRSNSLRTVQAISSVELPESLRRLEIARNATGSVSSATASGTCGEYLHDRPVGDPLTVREAPSADDPRLVKRAGELGDQSGLAHSRRAEDREELAGWIVPRPGRTRPAVGPARSRRPTIGARAGRVRTRRRLPDRVKPERLQRLRDLPLTISSSDVLGVDDVADQAGG